MISSEFSPVCDLVEMSESQLNQEEIARRKPVWLALSELWLDSELTDNDITHIATKMVDSGYSLAELRVICDSEIAPVVYSNLRSSAGVWDGFDEHWLYEKIISEMNKPKRWQDALLDPIRRVFSQTNHLTESEWPLLILKYRAIKRARHMIEL
jgi:hypothetical protein